MGSGGGGAARDEAADEGHDAIEQEADDADAKSARMMSLMRELFQASQMKKPMPTPPISISAATMASQDRPTPMRSPEKMKGAAAGSMIFAKYSMPLRRITFATLR